MLRFPAYITFQELFIYAALIKAISTGGHHTFIYKKPVVLLTVYLIVLFIFSILIGTSIYTLLKTVKWLLPWELLYSIPRLIIKKEEWDNFFALLLPFVIIGLIAQIVQLLLGQPLANLFGTSF